MPESSGIFLSYRREDAAHFAGRLVESIQADVPHAKVFIDVDSIELGADFVEVLDKQLRECGAMIVVIGHRWLGQLPNGKRRIDDPNDFVRLEVEGAIARKIPIIPILVDDAKMPGEAELPDSIKPILRRQNIEMDHRNYTPVAKHLTSRLAKLIGAEEVRAASGGWFDRRTLAIWLGAVVPILAGLLVTVAVINWPTVKPEDPPQTARTPAPTQPTGPAVPADQNTPGAETDVERSLSTDQIRAIQRLLCVPDDGTFGPRTREGIRMYQLRVSTAGPADGLIGAATYQHLMGTLASGNCDRNLYRNYFERSIASNTASINEIRMQLNAVANSGPPIANAGTFDSAMRAKIAAVRSALAQPAGDELTPPLAARLRSLPP